MWLSHWSHCHVHLSAVPTAESASVLPSLRVLCPPFSPVNTNYLRHHLKRRTAVASLLLSSLKQFSSGPNSLTDGDTVGRLRTLNHVGTNRHTVFLARTALSHYNFGHMRGILRRTVIVPLNFLPWQENFTVILKREMELHGGREPLLLGPWHSQHLSPKAIAFMRRVGSCSLPVFKGKWADLLF